MYVGISLFCDVGVYGFRYVGRYVFVTSVR